MNHSFIIITRLGECMPEPLNGDFDKTLYINLSYFETFCVGSLGQYMLF